MPTTFVGLVIFVAFLTPGFLYASQRRVLAPQSERSALMETSSVVSVSLITNAVALALFGLGRWRVPAHTPDIGAFLRDGYAYLIERPPYVLAWAMLLLACSCGLAVSAARLKVPRQRLTKVLSPVILDTSSWYEVFASEDVGSNTYPHAGLEFVDGSYISGRVVWFSTDVEESGDRGLVLGPPLQLRSTDGAIELDVQRVVVAARDIRRIDVTYIECESDV